ncbi:MAG TPA: zf-TFIIB domain-containing protein [Bryobacteraceae bacterium]|nr:zf-TFIIB domain-containing protein [Bryobacteraceae bacterium]
MNCPACGAAMRLDEQDDHFRCDFCGRLHFPEPDKDGVRVLAKAAGTRCPVCSEDLMHAAVGGARVLSCSACRGLLIPAETFLFVTRVLRAHADRAFVPARSLAARELDRRICCPRCNRLMDTHPYAGPGNIVIDNCARCHVNWLDSGELRRVASAPDPQYTAHE